MSGARWETMDLTHEHYAYLTREVASAWLDAGRLVAVIDEDAGGIVAYVISERHANNIVAALNEAEERNG